MHKHIVLAVLVLTGCASPFVKEGQEALRDALKTPDTVQPTPITAPPAAVQQAVMDAVREAPPIAAKPTIPSEPRFNLTVNNAKASEVFMGMVTGTPYSMLVHPDVTGTLTLNLKNVTVPEAMEAVRALYGYEYEVQGKRIIVPSPALQTRIYQLNSLAMQRKGMSDMRVLSGSVNASGGSGGTSSGGGSQSLETSSVQTSTDSKYWEEVSASLTTLVGESGSVMVSPQSGIIIVKAAPANLFMVEKYLRASELVSARQVMLEAKILDVQLSDGYQSGINWATLQRGGKLAIGTNGLNPDGSAFNQNKTVTEMLAGAIPGPAGSLFGLAFDDGDFGAVINLIKSQGTVHVLSSPRIATLNNQKAVLKVGTDDFFVTEVTAGTPASGDTAATAPSVVVQPFFSGIALDVTPQIDDKGNITLHVRPSVSNVTEKVKTVQLGSSYGNLVLPLASSSISETDSVVRLKDGQIVAIGGLMSQSFDNSKNRIPLLGDIPLLGQLFGNTSQASQKRELVVLIKTTLVRDSQDWNQDMTATRRRFEAYEQPAFRP